MSAMLSPEVTIFINGEPLNREALVLHRELILRPSDTTREVRVLLHEFSTPAFDTAAWSIFWRSTLIACSTAVDSSLEEAQFDRLDVLTGQISPGKSELWPHTHAFLPNSGVPRERDATCELLPMLRQLERDIRVRLTPAEHIKIGHKTVDLHDLAELHVDRFQGMRNGRQSVRRRVSRHFINLGRQSRTGVVAIMDPGLVDRHVPDTYNPAYLDRLYEHSGNQVVLLLFKLPPRSGNRLWGIRYLATHLLHCEYGQAGDLVAVINSDTEENRETLP